MRLTYSFSRIVSKSFREYLIQKYPRVFSDPAKIRMLYIILFRIKSKSEVDLLGEKFNVLHHKFIREQIMKNNNTRISVIDFLSEFQECIDFPLNITEYRYSENQAREYDPSLPDDLLSELLTELKTPRNKRINPVYFFDGSVPSARKESKARKDAHINHYQELESSLILNYFKNMNPIIYNPYYENVESLRELISSDPDINDNKKYIYLNHVDELSTNLEPLYFENSTNERVFAQGLSLQNLQSEYRMHILKGCITADLVSCHLTIAAYDWNIESLKLILESGVSIWEYLCKELNLDISAKPALKVAVYAIIYGGGENKIILEMIKSLLESDIVVDGFISPEILLKLKQIKSEIESNKSIRSKSKEFDKSIIGLIKDKTIDLEPFNLFLELPIIKDLIQAGEGQRKTATENKYIYLADGTKLYSRKAKKGQKAIKPYQLVSHRAISIERYIIESVFHVATKYPDDFRILSLEHDGFTFQILGNPKTIKAKTLTILNRLSKAVTKAGEEKGIKISLETK